MIHIILFTLFSILFDTEVEIQVSNVASTEGKLMLAVYDTPETFMEDGKEIMSRSIAISQTGTVSFSISLPEGAYAFAIFHDKNMDGKLNKKFIGMPKEPYGFSNSDSMMPPDFEQAKVEVRKATTVKISLR